MLLLLSLLGLESFDSNFLRLNEYFLLDRGKFSSAGGLVGGVSVFDKLADLSPDLFLLFHLYLMSFSTGSHLSYF